MQQLKEFLKKSLLSMQQIKMILLRMTGIQKMLPMYAINKLNIDWKEQALLKAKSYQMFHYSKKNWLSNL